MQINIKKKHILNGITGSFGQLPNCPSLELMQGCPLALAFQEQGYSDVTVTTQGVFANDYFYISPELETFTAIADKNSELFVLAKTDETVVKTIFFEIEYKTKKVELDCSNCGQNLICQIKQSDLSLQPMICEDCFHDENWHEEYSRM